MHLSQHRLQEQQRAIVHARHSSPVTSCLQLSGLLLISVLAAPSDSKWRVGKHEIEALLWLGKLVAGFLAMGIVRNQRVPEKDARLTIFLDEQVRLAHCVVRWGEFLAVNGDVLLHASLLSGTRCL